MKNMVSRLKLIILVNLVNKECKKMEFMISMKKNEELWKEAKKLCRLNEDDIRKAKELGFSPKTLIKNIPNKKEQWKAPVKFWIRDLYNKKHGIEEDLPF